MVLKKYKASTFKDAMKISLKNLTKKFNARNGS